MDVIRTLRELYEEKKRLDATIASLEGRLKARPVPARRRGRKSMTAEERLAVSTRMKRYWENRRGSGRAENSSSAAVG